MSLVSIFLCWQGNNFFKKKELELAVECYGRAMELDPTNATMPANRAMALLKLSRYMCEHVCVNSSLKNSFFLSRCMCKHVHACEHVCACTNSLGNTAIVCITSTPGVVCSVYRQGNYHAPYKRILDEV